MNSYFRLVLTLMFFCLAVALSDCGTKKKSQTEPKTTIVQVTGVVGLVGNEPFTEIIITGPDRSWYIAKEDKHKLMDLQHGTVTVEGEETVTELKTGNGRFTQIRRTLRNITIIAKGRAAIEAQIPSDHTNGN